MTPINVDSWLDIVANLWIGLVVLALAVIPGYMAARRNHKGIQEIKEQVVNGHDLDRVLASLDALAHDVRNLRHDISEEQQLRREVIAEMRDDFNRKLGAIKRAG
jgi:Protein of unknown function (DUF2746)